MGGGAHGVGRPRLGGDGPSSTIFEAGSRYLREALQVDDVGQAVVRGEDHQGRLVWAGVVDRLGHVGLEPLRDPTPVPYHGGEAVVYEMAPQALAQG
mgnify:CR=1 FL=1